MKSMQAKIARYKKAILAVAGGIVSIAGLEALPFDLTSQEGAALAGAVATLLVVFGPKNAE